MSPADIALAFLGPPKPKVRATRTFTEIIPALVR
jgi:hypothetical protein